MIIISIILVFKCSPTDGIMMTVDGGFKKMVLCVKISKNPIFQLKLFLLAHEIQKLSDNDVAVVLHSGSMHLYNDSM